MALFGIYVRFLGCKQKNPPKLEALNHQPNGSQKGKQPKRKTPKKDWWIDNFISFPSLPVIPPGKMFGWYIFGVQSYLLTFGVWKPRVRDFSGFKAHHPPAPFKRGCRP